MILIPIIVLVVFFAFIPSKGGKDYDELDSFDWAGVPDMDRDPIDWPWWLYDGIDDR